MAFGLLCPGGGHLEGGRSVMKLEGVGSSAVLAGVG
jgi:hypothetical protein